MPDTPDRILVKLHTLEGILPAAILSTLLNPISVEEMQKLREIWALPEELVLLWTWHNGQRWNAQLSKYNNRRLLSAAEIVEQHEFFNDPMSEFMEPWRRSWLPILTNDSGDYVVYETEGELAGQLFFYWHDDSARKLAYRSLEDWLQELLEDYEPWEDE